MLYKRHRSGNRRTGYIQSNLLLWVTVVAIIVAAVSQWHAPASQQRPPDTPSSSSSPD